MTGNSRWTGCGTRRIRVCRSTTATRRPNAASSSAAPSSASGVTAAATSVLTVAVQDTIRVAGLLGYLLYLNWQLTLIAIAVGPPIALFVRLLSRRLRSMAREAQTATGDLVHVLEETIECHKVVKVFGGQEYESRRFERANQRVRGFNMRQTVPAALTTPVTHTLAAVALAIIVYIALEQSISARATTSASNTIAAIRAIRCRMRRSKRSFANWRVSR